MRRVRLVHMYLCFKNGGSWFQLCHLNYRAHEADAIDEAYLTCLACLENATKLRDHKSLSELYHIKHAHEE